MALPKFDQVAIPKLSGSSNAGRGSAMEALNRGMEAFQNIANTQISRFEGELEEADTRGVAAIQNMASEFTDSGELTAALEGGLFDETLAGLRGDARLRAQDRIGSQIDDLLGREEREQRMDLANRTFEETVAMNTHNKNVEISRLRMDQQTHRDGREDRQRRINDMELSRDILQKVAGADAQHKEELRDMMERYAMYNDPTTNVLDITLMDSGTLAKYREELDRIDANKLDMDAAIAEGSTIFNSDVRNELIETLSVLDKKRVVGTEEQRSRINNITRELNAEFDIENNYYYKHGTAGAYTDAQVSELTALMSGKEFDSSAQKLMAKVMGDGHMLINIDGENISVPVPYSMLAGVMSASAGKSGLTEANLERLIRNNVITDIEKSGKPIEEQLGEYQEYTKILNRNVQGIASTGSTFSADAMRAAVDSQLYYLKSEATKAANAPRDVDTNKLKGTTLFDTVKSNVSNANLSPTVNRQTESLLSDLEGILSSKGISASDPKAQKIVRNIESFALASQFSNPNQHKLTFDKLMDEMNKL